MPRARGPLFVERQSYRRRRMMDAGRILPVAGYVLVLLPVLWAAGGRMGTGGQASYLFFLWLALVAAAAALSRPLRRELSRRDSPPPGPEDPP